MPSPITHPAYSRLVIAACSEVRRALDGSRLRAGGGILPPRPALSANRPSPHSLKTPQEALSCSATTSS